MNNRKVFLLLSLAIAIVAAGASVMLLRVSSDPAKIPKRADKADMIYDYSCKFLESGLMDKAERGFVMVIEKYPGSANFEKSLRSLASIAEGKDEKKAAFYYSEVLRNFPGAPDEAAIRAKVEDYHLREFLSPSSKGACSEHVVKAGDTLYGLAKKYNVTVALIKKMNKLESDTIFVGQKLMAASPMFSIVVSKAKNTLVLKKDGVPFKTYTVATGKNGSTPEGVFKIVDKMEKPVWSKPGERPISPDSEKYELGARWMPISMKGYGIHGTNDDGSIGRQSTEGCIRMRDRDVIELCDMIPRGTRVEIVK